MRAFGEIKSKTKDLDTISISYMISFEHTKKNVVLFLDFSPGSTTQCVIPMAMVPIARNSFRYGP